MGFRIGALHIIVLAGLFLGACSSIDHTASQQDGGPAQAVDVSHINDARPQPVVRTRAGNAKVYTVLGKTYRTLESSRGYRERGIASWYGTKFHGRRTANGEVYDMFAMTAAHKTLPIPSYVRVTNVSNGISVVVKINDRGPFHGNRLIDLSYAAARKLGIAAMGTGLVEVVDITPAPGEAAPVAVAPASSSPAPSTQASSTQASATTQPQPQALVRQPSLYLQLGAFQERASAQTLSSRLTGVFSGSVNIIEGDDKLHRVRLGPASSEQQIARWREVLQQQGLGQGYIVRRSH